MTQRYLKRASTAVVIVTLAAIAALGWTQDRAGGPPARGQDGFPDLVGGLEASRGCLGVEVAQTISGKNVIFAWFEDKQAVKTWYYSDMHQGVMDRFFPQREDRKPLAGIPDDIGPIMAIASITNSDKAHFAETNLPVSQIAIELYAPVAGGLHLGGTFAPKEMKVKGMLNLGPKAGAAPDRGR